MRNRATLPLAAAFAVIAAAGVYLGNELRLQKEQNEKFEVRVAHLEASGAASDAAAGAAPLQTASFEAPTLQATSVATTAPAASTLAASPAPSVASFRESMQRMLESPEGEDFRRIMMRQGVEERYPDMAKALNLPAAQVEKVLDFLAGRDVALDALESRLERARDRAEHEKLWRELMEKQRAYEAELANLIGESYPKWRDYDLASRERLRESNTRRGEERMRAAIVAGGSPLSDAQFRSVTAAMRAAEARFNEEAASQSMQQQLQRLPELARRQSEAATPLLDADQLGRLRKYLDQLYGTAGAMLSLMGESGDEPAPVSAPPRP